MQISSSGLGLIRRSEGTKYVLYNDADNHCSIGTGHLVHLGPICGAASEQPFLSGIDDAQAMTLLMQDVSFAEHAVEQLVKVNLSQQQYDALVSFTFNEGAGKLRSSTLLKVLNAGDYKSVPAQLKQWIYGDGRVLPGLVTRRAAEALLFQSN